MTTEPVQFPDDALPFRVEVTGYSEAIAAFPVRLSRFNIRYEDFDDLCSFPSGLTGKCLGPAQVKRFGIEKFFDALRGAGLRIILEEDPEQTAKMLKRIAENYNPRQANQARMNNHASPVSKHLMGRVFKHFSRLGVKARMKKTTKAGRSAHAQHAANCRWIADRKRKRQNRARRQGAAHRAANEETRAT